MDRELTVFSVGQCYEPLATKQDGFLLEWNNGSGFVLYAMLQNINGYEQKQFDVTHDLQIRYTIQREVCFFLYRFGDMPWSDCPFHPCIYNNEAIFPTVKENTGLTLNVVLVDSSCGKVVGLRIIGLGHDFSKQWLEWVSSCAALSTEEYNEAVNQVYMEFDSLDLANMAKCNEYMVKADYSNE